jgi:ribosomal silencing factor RsfS
MSAIRKQLHQSTPLQDDPIFPVVKHIAKSADLRKAIGVTAKRVSHLTEVTQFMVTIEGSNARQLQAIAGTIEVSATLL